MRQRDNPFVVWMTQSYTIMSIAGPSVSSIATQLTGTKLCSQTFTQKKERQKKEKRTWRFRGRV